MKPKVKYRKVVDSDGNIVHIVELKYWKYLAMPDNIELKHSEIKQMIRRAKKAFSDDLKDILK